MFKAPNLFALALCLAAGSSLANAEQAGVHLYEASKADPALSAEFQRIIKPVATESPWALSFGTTSPSTTESVDGKAYEVFWGCKPHDCISESYVVMYDRSERRIIAGAFVRNVYDGPALNESRITWLGKTEFDSARALGKYLY